MDYGSVSQTLQFTPGGITRMCVVLSITDDQIGEDSEFFTLTINGQPSTTVTITDNGKDPAQLTCSSVTVLIILMCFLSLFLDPVILGFQPSSYDVNEGFSLTVFVVANRQFVNGPFFVTVTSQDGTAGCMWTVHRLSAISLTHHSLLCSLQLLACLLTTLLWVHWC